MKKFIISYLHITQLNNTFLIDLGSYAITRLCQNPFWYLDKISIFNSLIKNIIQLFIRFKLYKKETWHVANETIFIWSDQISMTTMKKLYCIYKKKMWFVNETTHQERLNDTTN